MKYEISVVVSGADISRNLNSSDSAVKSAPSDSSKSSAALAQSVKRCFYLGLMPDQYRQMEEEKSRICREFQISLIDLVRLLEERSIKWSQKIEQTEQLIRMNPYTEEFTQKLRKKNTCRKLSEQAVRELFSVYMGLVLQCVSVMRMENHLKKKDVKRLIALLKDPQGLKPVHRQLHSPLIEAARGTIKPNSEHYLMQILWRIHLLGDYYDAVLDQHEGRKALCLETLKKVDWQESFHEYEKYKSRSKDQPVPTSSQSVMASDHSPASLRTFKVPHKFAVWPVHESSEDSGILS